jgi:hypothetical protein
MIELNYVPHSSTSLCVMKLLSWNSPFSVPLPFHNLMKDNCVLCKDRFFTQLFELSRTGVLLFAPS